MLIHVEPETLKRLKRLGLEQDRTLQALGLEALDTLLEKYTVSASSKLRPCLDRFSWLLVSSHSYTAAALSYNYKCNY